MIDDLIVHRLSRVDRQDSTSSLISIVIPVYNRASMIADAIESALSQDYQNLEIVISDNASSDETLSICLFFAELDSRITVASQPVNRGPVTNWLSATRLSKGKLIKFLFSDDILMPSCLTELSAKLQPDYGYVYSPCLVGEVPSNSMLLYALALCGPRISTQCALYDYALLRRMPFSPCAALFRRSDVIDSLNRSLLDPDCEESLQTGAGPDVRIYLDALSRYKYIAKVSNPVVFFRSHEGSFTIGPTRHAVEKGYRATLRRFFADHSIVLRAAYSCHPLASNLTLMASRIKLLQSSRNRHRN